MSAAHWEARRCQNALERRMARDRRLRLLQEKTPETTKTAAEFTTTPKDPAERPEDRGHVTVKTASSQRAKLSNRFSSLEYIQQW